MAKQLGDLQAIDCCAVLLRAVAASNLTEQNQSNGQPDYFTDKERSDERVGSAPNDNAERATQDEPANIDACAISPGRNHASWRATKRKKKPVPKKNPP